MDFIWVLFAFICGFLAKTVSLPPSIGYLVAGFILHFIGFQADETISELASLGITLMLFTIGLKLNIKDLLKTEVWAGAFSHTILWLILGTLSFKILVFISLSFVADLNISTALLIIFALSFSSTVCVVKLLEEHGELKTRHGKLAVAILVIQDVIAVIFLVAATGKLPSYWAILLPLVFLIKPLLHKLIDQAGHGELIPLTGFFLAFGSYELFELVNIKGDLGALLVGMFFASHNKAIEISKSLLSFKDLFLIGFFLTIGFTALPTWEMLGIATLLTLLIPLKFALFFFLFISLKLRGRTAYLSALVLSNFSEFGLIVASLSTNEGWLSKEWLVILSLAVTLSFIFTNICYNYAHVFFTRYKSVFKRYENITKLPEDSFEQPCDAPIVIIGMGRVGMGAYKALEAHQSKLIWGLDADNNKVNWLNDHDMRAYCGDAEDADFWENIQLNHLELILLALPTVQDVMNITTQLKKANYQGKIAAIARYDDEKEKLQKHGVDKVFNFYTEVGVGFAKESISLFALPEDDNR